MSYMMRDEDLCDAIFPTTSEGRYSTVSKFEQAGLCLYAHLAPGKRELLEYVLDGGT